MLLGKIVWSLIVVITIFNYWPVVVGGISEKKENINY